MKGLRGARHKATLVVLFIPSVQRDGRTRVDQARWTKEALGTFGAGFGGATAFPRAKGVWRDDERKGRLVFDQPVVVQCYTTPDDLADAAKIGALARFCKRMG